MNRKLIAIFAATTMLASNMPVFAASVDTAIYVSESGNDNAVGTESNPIKTVAKAIELAATKRGNGENVTIVFKDGTYRFDSSVEITSSISGTKDVSTVIKAEDGAEVIFKASKVLDASKAEAVTDETVLAKLYENVRDDVVVIDLAEQGLTQADILDPSTVNGNYALFGWEESWAENNAVYINGVEQQLSRWPNNREYATWSNGSNATFKYSDEAPSRWGSATDFWIGAFAEYDYSYSRMAVKSINTADKQITVIDNPVAKFTSDKSKRWAAFNFLEEIDIPGEYYIDRNDMKLYIYAPDDFKNSTLEIDVLATAMFNVVEADNITFSGINFAQTRSNAVFMKNVDNVDFVDCTFENIGVNGILCRGTQTATTGKSHWEVQQIDGSYNVDISGCDFYNIGMGAIDITGGNVDTLTKSNNNIEDCFISHTSQKSFWEAISIRGCGTTIKNNNISNTPMQVIRPWGSLHTIEYNEIYDALHENDDCGIIYWGGNSVLRGTMVQYNYMHDTEAQYNLEDDKHSAIYWDDLQSGMSAQKNIFANIDGSSLFLNGAGAITHKYNTTVNSDKVLNLQNHAQRMLSTVSQADAFTTIQTAKSELANKELYYQTFEGLKELLEDGKNPLYYNVITNNFSFGTDKGTVESEYTSYSTVKDNQVVSSGDYFVNAAAQDYRIKSSAASSVSDYSSLLNEDNFDIEDIGMQRDFALNNETAGFDLVYPANNELFDYTDGKVLFSWNAAPGANSYKLTVAKDSGFNSVVCTEETKFTTCEVTGLKDTETYYWKVEATNISRELGSTWQNNGGAYKFSYADLTTDFVTPVKPENIMTDPQKGEVFGNTNSNVTKVFNTNSPWNNTYGTYNGYIFAADEAVVSKGASYANVGGFTTTKTAGGLTGKTLVKDKAYVVSFLTKNIGSTDSFKLNMGLTNSDGNWAPTYTLEKGTEGYTVSDKEDWTKIAGTIVAPCASPFLSVGFMNGEAAGSKMEINLAYLPEDAIYFAEEVAYKFDVTADKTEVSAGDSATVSAELLNQVGTIGTLDQNFTWYAMDSERSEVVETIAVTPSADTKTAELSFDMGIETGTYVIVAYSEGEKLAKGVEIYVSGMSDLYKDYIPGAKPENMMTDPQKGEVFGNTNSNVTKVFNTNSPWNNTYGTYNGYIFAADETVVSSGASYANVGGFTTTNTAGGLTGKTLVKDKAYVVSFLVKNIGSTDSFKLNMGLTNSDGNWAPTYTLEKGTAGYTVTDKEDWTKIAGTIVAPCASPFLSVGFMNGEAAGSKMEINLAYQPEDAIYFAEEVAYDISAEKTSGDTDVYEGDSFTAEAKILNQVGTDYTGNQTFEWKALNVGRTQEIDGITITPSADTKTATVTVDSGVQSGTYVIVAVSNEYGMAKGFEINVTSTAERFKDYVPVEKPENMMTDPQKGEVFGNTNSNVTKVFNTNSPWNNTYGTYNGYIFAADETVVSKGASYANVGGFTTTNTAGGLSGKTLVKDKAYVVSFLTKNIGSTDSFKLNMGLTNSDGNWAPTYTVEKGTEGYTVTDKENWTKIAGTIVAPCASPFLSVGFMNGEAAGSKMEINLAYQPEDAIYFAEEKAYDIEVSADREFVNVTETFTAEANVFNQIGSKGTLNQNFTWYVLNADRTEEVEGFTISETGNKAEITVGDSVSTGEYTIVAVSDDYGMVKGATISVRGIVDIYKEHIIPEKPENMMTDPQKGEVFGNINSNVTKAYNTNSSWNNTYGAYNGYIFAADEVVVSKGASYANVGGFTTTNTAGGLSGKTLVKDKAYVVSFLTKNIGSTDSFKVNMGLTNSDGNWAPTYTLEKGTEGFTVSDKEDWTKIAGTIVAPCASPFLSVGFMNGEAAGSKMEINLSYLPEEAIYFAEEIPYDIEIEGSETVTVGESTSFTAAIINQIGTTGSLSQDIDWYVVNELRTAEAEEITISADGTLTVSDDAALGNYLVIARSEEYDMSKSFAITVAEKTALYEDHIPGAKPENMMTDPQKGEVFGNINSNVTKVYNTNSPWNNTYGAYNGYIFAADEAVVSKGASYSNVGGFTTTNTAGGLSGKTLVKDKAYVVSFLTKNIGTTDSFKVNMGLTNSDGNWTPTYTVEKGTEGYTVTDKENWTKIAGTIVAPCASPFLSVGFMNGEAAGSKMEINLAYQPEDAIYFAEEVAYDIEVNSENTTVSSTTPITVEANVLNQIGSVGTLDQNFTWYALSEDRTEEVTGFTLTEIDNKVTVSVDDTVETGNYTIVAVSDDYGFAKGIEITVTEPVYEVSEIEFTVENGTARATVTTDVAGASIFLAVYEGNTLKNVKSGVSGEELTLSGIASGNTVKVFAWNMSGLAPLTINPDYTTSITVQ